MAKKIESAPSKLKPEPSKPQSLRVLMVEDAEDDALLIIRELKKGGYDPVYERVETAAAMKKALQEKQWDIILCDYKMPKFNAPSAIAVLKETNIDVPLMIVSGAIGEEAAIECMRSGAQDYIMKNNLSRLCSVIARELEDAKVRNKHKQAEAALRASEEEARQLAQENAIMAEIGRVISSSLDINEIYGRFAEEARKLIPFDRISLNVINHKDQTFTVTYVIALTSERTGSRDEIPVPLSGTITGEAARTRASVLIQGEDLKTLHKRFPETQTLVTLPGAKSLMSVPLISKDTVIAVINTRSVKPNVYTENHLRLAEKIGNQIASAIANAQLYKERMLAEEELKKSEEEAKQLAQENAIMAEIGRIISSTLDIDEVYDRFAIDAKKLIPFDRLAVNLHSPHDENIRVAYIFGEAMSGRSKGDLFPLKGSFSETLINTRKGLYGYRAKTEESDHRFYNYAATVAVSLRSVLAVPLIYRDEVIASLHFRSKTPNAYGERDLRMAERIGAQIAGAIGSAKLFSDRKRAEEALRESEENFRRSLDDSPLGIRIATEESETLYANRALLDIYGYNSLEELNETPLKNRYTPESYAEIEIRREKRARGETDPTEYEVNIMRKNGEIRHLQVFRKEIIWNGVRQAQLIYIDITERKQAEEALHQSEKLFRSYLEYAPEGIYMNDLKGNFLYGNRKCEEIIGYRREELIGKNFLELNILSENSLNKAVRLLQDNMEGKPTGPDEIELISKEGRFIPVEVNTNVVQRKGQKIVLSFIRDITERKQVEEERKQSVERMRKALRATVQAISLTVEMKDPYTSGHQQRVSDLGRSIATEMGLSADRQDFIRTASIIHDLGKITLPTEILSKPTKLTDLEFSLIKTHSQSGYDILKDIDFPWPVADVVLQHHERLDGSGYPQGLKGDDILLEARIISIADVVEAIASHRPYRPALGIDIALEEISRNKGILYDAAPVDACLKLFREKGYALVLQNR